MRKMNVLTCIVTVVLLGAGPAAALPTADELLKKVGEAQKDAGTVSADTKVSMSMGPMPMTGTGKMAGKRDMRDGKPVRKFYQVMKTKATAPNGQEIQMQQTIVNDGKYLWTEIRHPMMPVPMVTKQRSDDPLRRQPVGDPTAQMAQFNEMYDLKVTGENRVDNVKVYVLEGTLRDAFLKKNPDAEMMKVMMHKMKTYIGQEDLFPRKLVYENAEGRQTTSMELSNVKVNPKLDDSLFKYTPPPGARVIDQTGE